MPILERPSPNFNARPHGTAITAVVLHADAGTSEQGTIAWVCDPASKVSYHYLIGRAGSVYRFVPDLSRAWHAGVSAFHGVPDCNAYALGVSFANDQVHEPFTAAAIDAGVVLVAQLCRRYHIPTTRVTTHAAVATPAGRKHDPGPTFPFAEFIRRVGVLIAVPF